MRVLHCIYDDVHNPWVGGGGAAVVRSVYPFLADRCQVTVLAGAYPGAREHVEAGVRYRYAGVPGPYPLSRLTYSRAAERALRAGDYDAAVYDFSVYTPIRVPRHRPVGIVVHHLSGPTARERWGRALGGALARMEGRLLRRASLIRADSSYTARAVRELVDERTPVLEIGNAVDPSFFRVERAERDYLLYIGRLDVFQKGLDLLMQAAARLAQSGPRFRLLVAGRGREGAELERLVQELGLGNHVELLGAVSDEKRLELLAGAMAVVMPSRFEGFGLVAVEAMAAGVPVIASDGGSLPQIMANGEAGLMIPADDVDAIVDAMRRVLTESHLRVELSERARRRAADFSWERIAEEHYGFLRQVAAGSDRTQAGA